MMCYQISQSGEPVALVASIGLARRIVECQPPGFYDVDTLEVGAPMSPRRARARKSSSKNKIRRGRHKANKQPGQGVHGSVAVVVDRRGTRPVERRLTC